MFKIIDLYRIIAEREVRISETKQINIRSDELERLLADIERSTEKISSSKTDEEKAQVYATKGHIKWELDLPEKALEDVEKALAIKELPIAYDIRGRIKTNLGQNKEAIQDFDKAIALDPKVPKSYQYRALAKRNLGLLEDALKDVETALSMNNNLMQAHYIKGIIKIDQKKYEEAVQSLDTALKLDPKYPYQAYNNRGLAKYYLKKLDEAKADLDKAIKLEPGFASAHYHRGLVAEAQKLFSEAIYDYEQARNLDAKYNEKSNEQIKACSKARTSKEDNRDILAGFIGVCISIISIIAGTGICGLIASFNNKKTPVTATHIATHVELPAQADSEGQRNIELLTTTDNPEDKPSVIKYGMNEACYQRFLEQNKKLHGPNDAYFLKTADQDGNFIITEDEITQFEETWANRLVESRYGPHKGNTAVIEDVDELVKKMGDNPVQYMEALKSIDTNNDKEITLEELKAAKKKQDTK